MDLKDKLLTSFLAFEDHVDVHSSIHDIRSEAIKIFETQGFPGVTLGTKPRDVIIS